MLFNRYANNTQFIASRKEENPYYSAINFKKSRRVIKNWQETPSSGLRLNRLTWQAFSKIIVSSILKNLN